MAGKVKAWQHPRHLASAVLIFRMVRRKSLASSGGIWRERMVGLLFLTVPTVF